MLPNISLDTDRYKEILDGARNMIVSQYPEWTDFNYHDPGITMLEMFSWIKESQQYYIDQIGEENRKKFLKLLGVQPRAKVPARAEVQLIAGDDFDVLKGTKFYAGETCFEADERIYILKNDISRCVSFEEEEARIVNRWQLNLGGKLKILPFGREPQVNNCFYLGFDEALPKNIALRAQVDVFDDYKVKRTPIVDFQAFYPLAKMVVEVNTKKGWQPVTLISDESNGFLCSGSINIFIDLDMEPSMIEELEAYYLRLRLTRNDYDVPPVIQSISFNSIAVRQRDTQSEVMDLPLAGDGKYRAATELSISGMSQIYLKASSGYHLVPKVIKNIDYENNCAVFEIDVNLFYDEAEGVRLVNSTSSFANSSVAGYGTGLPLQEIDIHNKNIEYESFEIMTEDTEVADCYLSWVKVSDFSTSTPEDRHYVFDSAAGILKFGDCKKGMAPEGTILIIGYVRTLGIGGNVKQNTINRIGQEDIPEIKVINKANAVGGEDEETLDDCFKRARRMLKKPRSAVTYADYENYVLQTPGLMIESCKVIPANLIRKQGHVAADMKISIVVKPFYPERAETISDAYVRNIKSYLDNFRLLGTSIELIAPEYVGVTVYADITVKPHYQNAQTLIEEAVKYFFFGYKDQFGAEVIYSELYGIIDRLDCVSYVADLSMEAKGNGISRTKEGNIVLPANGVVLLSDTQFMFSVEH
ncbi:MAG: hypothetical protein GXY50_02250 [Syntrophomonadaceae bacterium]|nr:hypothetical protein [Syntrophomonadaceae bacterium]